MKKVPKETFYPVVLSEDETLDLVLWGKSIARFGDGELRMCLGGSCSAQVANPELAAELRQLLMHPEPNLIVGIPNCYSNPPSPKFGKTWFNYVAKKYVSLYGYKMYGSSFITRPDSAPWIDRPDYWDKIASLWRGKHVILVSGTDRSLRGYELVHEGAISVSEVRGLGENAYAQIDELEARIFAAWSREPRPVLLCLGPTATILAARLTRKGVHAVDIGHVGMFMRRKAEENAANQSGVQSAS